MQALLARAESLDQAWRALQQRKANLQHQKPKLAAQIVLSGLARSRSLPAERLFHYERERVLQEEERLRSARAICLRFRPRSRSSSWNSRFSSSAKRRHERVGRGVLCFVTGPSSLRQVPSLSPAFSDSSLFSTAHHVWQSQHPPGENLFVSSGNEVYCKHMPKSPS